jgi:hypothetical protein
MHLLHQHHQRTDKLALLLHNNQCLLISTKFLPLLQQTSEQRQQRMVVNL